MDDKSAIAAGEGEVVFVEASLLLKPPRRYCYCTF